MLHDYPYTDAHELNLDWIIGKIKHIDDTMKETEEFMEAAQAAQAGAETAQDAAETAQEKAETAQDAAETAQGKAEDAQEAAETAQGKAEDAQEAAEAAAVAAVEDAQEVVNDTISQIALLQARVDNIIPDGTQTAGNTELLDIRVSADGHTYSSAGDAVRGQIEGLNAALGIENVYDAGTECYNLFDLDEITLNKTYSGTTETLTDSDYWVLSDYIPVRAGFKTALYYSSTLAFSRANIWYKIGVYDPHKNWLYTIAKNNESLSVDGWYDFDITGFIRIAYYLGPYAYADGRYRELAFAGKNLANINPDKIEKYNKLTRTIAGNENLCNFDIENKLIGYGYSEKTGTIVEAPNRNITGYIPFNIGDVLNFYILGDDVLDTSEDYGVKFAIYDKNKVWFKTYDMSNNPGAPFNTSPCIPNYEGYLRMSYYNRNDVYLEIFSNKYKLIDKKYISSNKLVDVIIFAGQSNMAGRGISNDSHPERPPKVPIGQAYEYRAITAPDQLSPLTEPFGVAENNPSGINDGNMKTGDMVAAFAIEYYKNNGNVTMVGISASKGGSGIDDWQPNAASGYLADALQRFEDCVTFLTTNGYTIRHKYLCWCQGEHDWETYSTYASRWQTMFDEFKDAGIEKCLMVRIGNTNTGDGHFTNIIATETEMAKTNKDIVMVSTTLAGMSDRHMMKDDLHFYQDAYNEVGAYSGVNAGIYAITDKEPTMYDPEYDDLYYTNKN